ncbi:MAG TPA: lipase family protein [Terracidiphilus sp.]|nr:lipase family protein [Terracidiphilus sp.]
MPSVDWKAAIEYAQLVAIAYSVAPAAPYTADTIAAIANTGYTFVEALYGNELATDVSPHQGETVTYGFLATSAAGELVAAIRGTDTIQEWLHDLAFLFVPNPIHSGGGLTEDGFTAIYRSLRAGADPNSPSAIAAITNLVSSKGISRVTVTGHSLGAALATLLGLDAGLNSGVGGQGLTVYTFASPRVGEMFFHHTCDSVVPDIYRIYNRFDLVPQAPFFPYEHVGNGLELVPPFNSVNATLVCWHSIETYLWLMDRQTGGNALKVGANCRGSAYPGPV